MLNVLGTLLIPSDALIINVYTVSVEILGNVPDITPVEEFKVTPDGKEPDARL